jgi:RES domain-containing protein
VSFDDGEMETVEAGVLPRDWGAPVAPASNRALGDAWLDRALVPVLRVPSAVIPRSWNFVLNPAHPGFASVEIGSGEVLTIDPRLRGR